jgi:hypothetical protein
VLRSLRSRAHVRRFASVSFSYGLIGAGGPGLFVSPVDFSRPSMRSQPVFVFHPLACRRVSETTSVRVAVFAAHCFQFVLVLPARSLPGHRTVRCKPSEVTMFWCYNVLATRKPKWK